MGNNRGKLAVSMSKTQLYQGPIPSPESMAEYAKINSSFPERIMVLTEKQSAHRQEMESQNLTETNVRTVMSIRYGAFLVVFTEIVGLICALTGRDVAALAAIISPIVSLGIAFIYGTNSNRKERLQKWNSVSPSQEIPDKK